MKLKIILGAIVSLSVAQVYGAAEKVTVQGGQINFNGSVVSAPCAVDNDNLSQTVKMGQIPVNALSQKGSSGSAVRFAIKLVGCDLAVKDNQDPTKTANYTKASVVFNGITTGDDSTLALSGSGSADDVARNVGIQIMQNSNPVKVNGTTPTAAALLASGSNEIPFTASYVATGNDVVAGTANAIVNFSINYE